jgi:SNF2 family DNA or RNA helicase
MRTYGTVFLDQDPKFWVVQCDPHVAIKLKRVFAKLQSDRASRAYRLLDTIETSRDLEWFLDRYPMEMSPADAERLKIRANGHREQMALVDRILSRKEPSQAFELAIPAREYQKEAATLVLASGGLLLADELGVGKTASAICMLTDPRTRPALVVTLTALPRQWRRELSRFAPKLRSHILTKGTPYDLDQLCTKRHRWETDPSAEGGLRCLRCGASHADGYHGRVGFPDVIITSYSKLAGWAEVLSGVIRSVTYDEVQELRRAESTPGKATKKYEAAEMISRAASYRLGMTGTPIYGYGSELFHVVQALKPDALGTWEEFRTEWCTDLRVKDPKALGTYARESGIILRRTRADVGRELPPLTRNIQKIDVNMEALDEVSESCAALARFVLGLGSSPLKASAEAKAKGEHMLASEELSWRLRQATGIAKAVFVADIVRMLAESEESVLLFGWHREVFRMWLDRLRDFDPAMYTGSESANEKDSSVKRFVAKDTRILIMSLRAGAGLDGLQQVCSTGVFGELDWSPGVHTQCEGRFFRDGQTSPCMAIYPITDVGSDPIVADVLGVKEQQIHGLRDPNAELVDRLDQGGGNVKRLAQAYLDQVAGRSRVAKLVSAGPSNGPAESMTTA